MGKYNDPNSPDFEFKKKKKNPNRQSLLIHFQKVASQEYTRIIIIIIIVIFSFSTSIYLLCSQMWLNYLLNDCHFGYIKKILKRNPAGQ
jgi:hypothetical protein